MEVFLQVVSASLVVQMNNIPDVRIRTRRRIANAGRARRRRRGGRRLARRGAEGLLFDEFFLSAGGNQAFNISTRNLFRIIWEQARRANQPNRVSATVQFRGPRDIRYYGIPGRIFGQRTEEAAYQRFLRHIEAGYRAPEFATGQLTDQEGNRLELFPGSFSLFYGPVDNVPARHR